MRSPLLRRALLAVIVPDTAEDALPEDEQDLTPGQQWLLATMRRRRWTARIVTRVEEDGYGCGWDDAVDYCDNNADDLDGDAEA